MIVRVLCVLHVAVLCLTVAALPCCTAVAPEKGSDPQVVRPRPRIGIYDSRSVALAYGRSKAHDRLLASAVDESKAAKQGGDTARDAQIDARMRNLQHLRHLQVFGNAPIHDILREMGSAIEEEARKVGADLVVRDVDVAFRGEGVEVVDITSSLVERFEPTEKTRRMIADLKTHPPIPLEEMPADLHEH